MNQRQRLALLLGGGAFLVAAVLIVPWELARPLPGGPQTLRPLGYAPIFAPPDHRSPSEKRQEKMFPSLYSDTSYPRVDRVRLFVQLLAVGSITAVAMVALRGPEDTAGSDGVESEAKEPDEPPAE